jgi:hypothetical protein
MITTTSPIPKVVYTLAYVAIIAAFIGAVADVLLLYNPAGGYEKGDYFFLLPISEGRLLAGHYLGIFFIPISMLGLLHVYHSLKPGGITLAAIICLAAVYLGFPGVVYHGAVGPMAWFIHHSRTIMPPSPDSVPPVVHAYVDALAVALPLGFAIVSGLFTFMVWKRPTRYNKWMLFCNPATFYIVIIITYLVIPPVGNVLAPAGFNLSFMLFFICSLRAERQQPA